jgi:mitogen-activated protein kinase 1/3
LADRDCTLKICDFNLARSVDTDDEGGDCVDDEDGTESLREDEEGDDSEDDEQKELSKLAKPRRHQRTLSVQVATRAYRAPEVILTLKYTEAMDVWAAGCIIAELFMALNTEDRTPQSGPLFRGREAYPLSQDTYSLDRTGDQLDRIFDVLGTPSDEELSTIPHDGVRQHVRAYADRIGIGLSRRIPVEATEVGLHLLERMIVFLPERRMSMQDAVAHQFFEPVQGIQRANVVSGHLDLGFDEASLPRTASANIDQLQKEIDSFRCLQD